MSSFSLRHRLHLLFVLLYGWAFVMMRHDNKRIMSSFSLRHRLHLLFVLLYGWASAS